MLPAGVRTGTALDASRRRLVDRDPAHSGGLAFAVV